MRPILSKLFKHVNLNRKTHSPRHQGPFLVSLEPKKSSYTSYREPAKDFKTFLNITKFLGALWAYIKVIETKDRIQMADNSIATIENKMEYHTKLCDGVSKVGELLEQTNSELKKLNHAVLELHREMKVQWEKETEEI